MTRMYYVELGELVWDTDDNWQGQSDTWDALVCAPARQQAYYPESRYWMFSAGDATSDVMDYFGIDFIEDVTLADTKFKGQYGIVSACEVPDDYASMLVEGESISASGEQYISYNSDNIHIAAIKYGDSIGFFRY